MSLKVTSSRLSLNSIVDNRYEIKSVIAKGGMGWIYLARHIYIDRPTVIKVLDIEQEILNSEEYRTRFCCEAKVAANIEHPNIIKIYDFGFIENNVPYIAMQYLEGCNLQQELEYKKNIKPLRALKICKAILSALSVAHINNIVHKDIKPANIYLIRPGTILEQVIVLDFGVARVQDNTQGMTRAGELMGTPEYLSPEYITQQIATPALDVYSIALLFLEMLTGETVIQGETPMQRLLSHLLGKINIPKKILESPLGPVLDKALQSDYKIRYENAQLFLDALEQAEIEFIQIVKNAEMLKRNSSSPLPVVNILGNRSTSSLTTKGNTEISKPSSPSSIDMRAINGFSSQPFLPTISIPYDNKESPAPNNGSTMGGWKRPQNVYDGLIWDAIAAYKKQDYETALSHLLSCQKMHPGSVTLKTNIAKIMRKIEQK